LIPVLKRLHRLFDRYPVAADGALVGAVLVVVASELLTGKITSIEPPVSVSTADVVFSLALVTPLFWARRAPVAVFALVMLICLAQFVTTDHVLAAQLAPLVAIYSLVAYGSSRRLELLGLAVALVGGVFVSFRATLPGALDNVVLGSTAIAAQVLLAALLGDRRRSRYAQLQALRELNRLLAVERDQEATIAAARERARIARELHDVVAHSLSVMVLQADGGRYAAAQDPDAAAGALARISDTGREALAQMRRLLGVLRVGDEQDPGRGGFAPQPGVAELDALVQRVAESGLPAELHVQGRPRALPGGVDVTVYRVVQEALTNVLKHAGPAGHVEVVLRYLEDAVEVAVRDDGQAVPAGYGDGGGQGLLGMRERAELHGGTLTAGPLPERGYEVQLRVPASDAAVVAGAQA
jgi:signal transduction histidine kinase